MSSFALESLLLVSDHLLGLGKVKERVLFVGVTMGRMKSSVLWEFQPVISSWWVDTPDWNSGEIWEFKCYMETQ